MLVVAATERELAPLDRLRHVLLRRRAGRGGRADAARARERTPDAVAPRRDRGLATIEPLAARPRDRGRLRGLRARVVAAARRRPDPTRRCSARLRAALPEAHVLPIGTSAHGRRHDATVTVEAMEGFGVLRACALAGVPAVELRAISNSPDEPDRAKWRFEEALRRARRRARSTRRPLGTRRCRARSARRRRRRGSPRRVSFRIWSGVPWWTTTTPPGSTSTRSDGSPRSIVSVPLERDEDLFLVGIEVPPAARVRRIAPHPRARLGHAAPGR